MMDERREEQAGLYVLEGLAPAERQDFEAALAGDAQLQSLVAGWRAVRDALAGAVPPASLPPHVKKRLLADLDDRDKKNVPPLSPKSPSASSDFLGFWFPWTVTAVVVVLAVNWRMDKRDLTARVILQHDRIEELNQLADSLGAATNTLSQTVATLSAESKVDDVRIALLGSPLTDFPKPVGVCLWDSRQQSGVLATQYLTPLPPEHDYQLWIIDPQYLAPVSAGVFQVDNMGVAHIHFKPDKTIATARQFTVTMEPKGGSPAPTFKNMVLVGGGEENIQAPSTNLQ